MLLVGINAKFIHSNLAIRYIARMDERYSFREYTISDRPEQIAGDLFKTGARVFLFSCYIWNLEIVLKVCDILKKADDSLLIGLAGPEVSYDPAGELAAHPETDFVFSGEGEPAAVLFADAMETDDFSMVPGLFYRRDGKILASKLPAREASLEQVPFPYTEADIMSLRNKIVYYETSRGCPYRCAFCLSGSAGSLRFLPLERVKEELLFFIGHKVPLVKLVDRTFNADPKRALSIVEFIKELGGQTTFHFEVRAETMTEDLIHSLATAPPGMFQLEIGVQSTAPDTLTRINRQPGFEKLRQVVSQLMQYESLHLHLDLIAGLPGENYETFVASFNQVMALRPHTLQLGFLKKLKGAALEAPGSAFSSFPPYEIIHSDAMSYDKLQDLKAAEDMLEKYYNSGIFRHTLAYLLDTYYPSHEFDFFQSMASWPFNPGGVSRKMLFEALYAFCRQHFADDGITYRLMYDYSLRHRDLLSFMKSGEGLKEQAFALLKQADKVRQYFGEQVGEKPASLYKKYHFVPIGRRVFAFDCKKICAYDVTEEFNL